MFFLVNLDHLVIDSDLELIEVERRSNPEGDQQPSSQLQSLPRDLVLHILSRLPVSSLGRLKSVCRGWRMLAQDLVNMHSTCMGENNPCLIFHSDCTTRERLYFVEYFPACSHGEEEVKRFRVPLRKALRKFDVIGSSNGLLCLSASLHQNDAALYVCNPFIRNYVLLPNYPTQYPNQEVTFGFGFHPTTKEYKVIKLVHDLPDGTFYRHLPNASAYIAVSEVQIFTLGSSTWRSLVKARGIYFSNQSLSLALVNGRLHWVTLPDLRRMEIISFDLADEQFREVPSTPLKDTIYELVVLGGYLSAAVCLNYSGTLEIWVMREYDVEESWIKKLNIRAHIPKGLKEDLTSQIFNNSRIRRHRGFWGHLSAWRPPRVLCLLKTGEILMEYESRVLVSYDPESGEFKELMFQGIPKSYRTIVHAGSLNWID